MSRDIAFNLKPLSFDDIPDASSAPDDFATFLDSYFEGGLRLANSMDEWSDGSLKEHGTVRMKSINTGYGQAKLRKSIGVSEYWCGRISTHDPASLKPYAPGASEPQASLLTLVRQLSKRLSFDGRDHRGSLDLDEVARQARVLKEPPRGIYEHFRRGLLEYHAENEREYLEAARETECLGVLIPHVAEVWRLSFEAPPPANPRTFVALVLSRELTVAPRGQRAFMNICLPFIHPDCQEKVGAESSRVRGRLISVELVREIEDGERVEWRTATSSDAGGSIPRFVTNSTMPKSVAEDVPTFLRWMMKKYPSDEDSAESDDSANDDIKSSSNAIEVSGGQVHA